MPPDPERIAETRAWLRKAAEDIRAARFEQSASPPLSADIAFHAQQAAEKAMKSFLAWHDKPFGKTHNLVELGRGCVNLDPSLEPLLRRAAPLTEYAWKFRYPGDAEMPSTDEAAKALGISREVLEAIASRLPREASA